MLMITILVVLFSVHCVLDLLVWADFGGVRFAGFSFTFEEISMHNVYTFFGTLCI